MSDMTAPEQPDLAQRITEMIGATWDLTAHDGSDLSAEIGAECADLVQAELDAKGAQIAELRRNISASHQYLNELCTERDAASERAEAAERQATRLRLAWESARARRRSARVLNRELMRQSRHHMKRAQAAEAERDAKLSKRAIGRAYIEMREFAQRETQRADAAEREIERLIDQHNSNLRHMTEGITESMAAVNTAQKRAEAAEDENRRLRQVIDEQGRQLRQYHALAERHQQIGDL